MNKKYLLYAIIPAIVLGSAGAAVYASSTTGKTNPMSGLISAIAEKFNLEESDVQAVFDDYQTQAQANRQKDMSQKVEDELAQAVTDGKLTQSQADLIIAKRAELEADKPAIDKTDSSESKTSKTKEELDAKRAAQQAELKQWATDNNIPEEYIRFVSFGGFGGGQGGPNRDHGFGPKGQKPTSNETTTSSEE